ncbi:cellulose binding domain-containing protein [Ruminococcus flavefaciens]|uniref:cellulose binding domain-containing protein n=1 Tax=Ruminococcus flavefaciens TaxID=1265 RepID=UPI0004910E9C|nr:cellulose binding domain-containing protein [Ruminococcus flavefaciens]
MGTNKFFRRAASSILAAAVMTTFVPSAIYASAAADVTTYSYEGFDVTYSVEKTWTGAQSICVTLTNTGDESIVNWALKYDLGGTPSNMWNAQVYSNKDSEYVIRNNSWNYEIAPDSSVYFGYILSNEEDIAVPTAFELCSERVDVAEGYDVSVAYTDEWNTGMRGEVTITNTTDAPIEAWTLSFDTNFEITDLWDARTVGTPENGRYTVASPYWSDAIPAGGSVTFGFVGRVADKGEDYTAAVGNYALTSVVIDPEKKDPPQPDEDLALSASEKEIRKGTGTKTVYFYAQTELDVTSVSLYDASSDTVAAAMMDDGKYSTSGDDMQGDGVFSCKLDLDISAKNDFSFVAKAVADGEEIVSNDITVVVYETFSDDQKACIQEVQNTISALVNSDEFHALPLEDRVAQTQALLESLSENGTENKPFSLIKEGSIRYNEASKVFTFKYPSGIISLVRLDDGNTEATLSGSTVVSESDVVLSGPLADGIPSGSVEAIVFNAVSPDIPVTDSFFDSWRDLGADVKYDDTVTVAELRNQLSGNDVIYMIMHGLYADFDDIGTTTIMLTNEICTDTNLEAYAHDWDEDRIGVIIDEDSYDPYYVILPKLYSDCYSGSKLSDAVVALNTCQSFGADGDYFYGLGDAFIDSGASAVVGFHNSIYASYAIPFTIDFIDHMINGDNCADAFDACKTAYGDDDGHNGVPVLYGDYDALISAGDLINGDYEKLLWPLTNLNLFIPGWKKGGDARVVNKLGPIDTISNSHMAILTTGVGSGENVYISGGTEGSYLSQTFKIPEGAETLSFYYNFVSEEPMEYVGSKFDDKFTADIYDVNDNNVLRAAFESVNTSSWTAVSGINFDGGDSTCYETGWKKVNIDVSQCTGKYISMRFSVTDVGDSIYDTAVLIDKVCFE